MSKAKKLGRPRKRSYSCQLANTMKRGAQAREMTPFRLRPIRPSTAHTHTHTHRHGRINPTKTREVKINFPSLTLRSAGYDYDFCGWVWLLENADTTPMGWMDYTEAFKQFFFL